MDVRITEHLRVTRTLSWNLTDELLKIFQTYSPELEDLSWDEIMNMRGKGLFITTTDGYKEYFDDILTDFYCENLFDEDAEIIDEREIIDYDDGFYEGDK